MTGAEFGLGRRVEFDERSRGWPVRDLKGVGEATLRLQRGAHGQVHVRHRCWIPALDQGALGSCVGNGWVHARATSPGAHGKGSDEEAAVALYGAATVADGFDGEYPPDDTGSSVLGGAKAAVGVGRRWWASYHWAFNIDEVAAAVMEVGPVVIGIPWYESMFYVDDAGYLVVDFGSGIAGGHCLMVRGVTLGLGDGGDYFLLRNSWGSEWGVGGEAKVRVADLASLLYVDGEACVPVHAPKRKA